MNERRLLELIEQKKYVEIKKELSSLFVQFKIDDNLNPKAAE